MTKPTVEARAQGDDHPDNQAVERFAQAMKSKLAYARNKGRSGWDDPEQCNEQTLAHMLLEHIGKGNPGTFEDIANFCMMLHQRGADPAVLQQSQQAQGELPPVPYDEYERAVAKELEERDYWHDKATELANRVGEHFGFDVGEHSNLNCPVQTALDAYWPAPAAVPDVNDSEIPSDFDVYMARGYRTGYRACRDKVLAAAPAAAPDGYELTPKRIQLSGNDLDAISWLCGGANPQSEDLDERWMEGTLWVGAAVDDDGCEHWGLHISNSEYPEEGCMTLESFERPATAHFHPIGALDEDGEGLYARVYHDDVAKHGVSPGDPVYLADLAEAKSSNAPEGRER